MLPPEIFEQLLASYPAEKRELARQIFHRFTDSPGYGDFFSELCVALDVYAFYMERIPQAVIAADQSALTALAKLRDEVNLLAQGMDKRNLNIANLAGRTQELCRMTQAKCDETTERFEALLRNIGTEIDTEAIVSGIKGALEASINREVIGPFVSRSEELAQKVIPTLNQLRDAASKAKDLWPARIWKTAMLSGLSVGVAISIFVTTLICLKFNTYSEDTVAGRIVAADGLIATNLDAFRQMGIAGVPVEVARSTTDGTSIYPGGFVLILPNAESAKIHPDGKAYVFFTSPRKEREIQRMEQCTETLVGPSNGPSANDSPPTR
jgi:hypothetical protein